MIKNPYEPTEFEGDLYHHLEKIDAYNNGGPIPYITRSRIDVLEARRHIEYADHPTLKARVVLISKVGRLWMKELEASGPIAKRAENPWPSGMGSEG